MKFANGNLQDYITTLFGLLSCCNSQVKGESLKKTRIFSYDVIKLKETKIILIVTSLKAITISCQSILQILEQ